MDRNIVSLTLFNVFRGLAAGGYMAFFAVYVSSLGYGMDDIGVIITVANVIGALLSPSMGYVLEVYSSRVASTVTGLMAAASLAIAAYTSDIMFLGLSYTLFMLSFYFGQPARMTFLARVVDRNHLGSVVGFTGAVFTASRSLGPVIAGFIIIYLGYMTAFSTLAFSSLIGSIIFYALSREPEAGKDSGRVGLLDVYVKTLKPEKNMVFMYAFVAVDRAAWMLWFPMLGAHFKSIGYGEASIGLLMGASNIVETLAMPLAGRLADRVGAYAALTLSEVSAALAALGLGLGGGSPFVAFASMLLVGLSISFWIPGYNAFIARVYSRIGEAYASTNAVRSLAGIPSPYLGGVLYETLAPLAPFMLCAVMLIPAAITAILKLKALEVYSNSQLRQVTSQA